MTALPNTWLQTTLGSIVEYGNTLKSEPSEIDENEWILELEDIEKDTSKLIARISFKERKSKSTKNRFEVGDVLYGKLRPYLNKVLIADRPGYCTTEIVPLKPGKYLDNRYLFYWLKHPIFLDYVESESHGLNMPRLGTEKGRAAPFVLAPINEQKRIADKLDAVLARVDACRDRLDRIPAIIKRFRQSVLEAAISGTLTKDIYDTEWEEVLFESLLVSKDKLSYGVLKPGEAVETGVPMFRVVDIGEWGKRNPTTPSMISRQLSNEFERTIIQSGDILLSVMATIGRAMVATDDMVGANVNRAIAVIKPNQTKIISNFLLFHLLSPRAVKEFEERSIGSAQLRINLGDLRKFKVRLPSINEQLEIVRRVESLFAYADRLEARYNTARAQVEKLTLALLAKAFRGELVPQDPNDEPASELLARIEASKATEAPKQTRKPATRKTTRALTENAT